MQGPETTAWITFHNMVGLLPLHPDGPAELRPPDIGIVIPKLSHIGDNRENLRNPAGCHPVQHDQEPILRDLRPFPETPAAEARGCRCRLVRNRDGSPVFGQDGRLIYSFTKGCPIPNHDESDNEPDEVPPRGLRGGRAIRLVLNAASGAIPFVGGVLSAGSAAWSEREQEKVNSFFEHWLKMLEQEMAEKAQTILEIMARLDMNDEKTAQRVASPEYQSLIRKAFREWAGA
jgi:hypothetical protein